MKPEKKLNTQTRLPKCHRASQSHCPSLFNSQSTPVTWANLYVAAQCKKTNKKTHFTLHVDDVDVLPHLNSRECRQQLHSVVMEIKSETKATASLLV